MPNPGHAIPDALQPASWTQEVPCNFAAVGEMNRRARQFLADAGVDPVSLDTWELAVAEAANNAVRHVHANAAHLPIRIDLLVTPDWVEARIADHTPGFEWPEHADLPPDDSESGRGIFLIQNLTDHATYLRARTGNCLVLRKDRTPVQTSAQATAQDPAEELRQTQRTLEMMTDELASCYESLSAIFRFSAELQEGSLSDDFIQRWLEQLLAITESHWYVLRLVDPSGQQLETASASAPHWNAPPLRLEAPHARTDFIEVSAVARRQDVWFDAHSAPLWDDPLGGLAQGGCGFAHPLFVEETLMGVLTIGRHPGHAPYKAGAVSVVQMFGDFLSLQIRSRQMREDHLRTQLHRRDLEIATRIHRMLIPERLPPVAQATLAGFYRSAREVGGDYYDALPVGDEGFLLVVADVMGKGLPAALFAFIFRSLVRSRLDLAPTPGAFLDWLSHNLHEELDRAEMFVTAQLAYFDRTRGEVRVSSAGHPPLLLASPDGRIVEASAGGPPLGITRSQSYPAGTFPWPDGHALMFTDGLTEARNPKGELLGQQPVLELLSRSAQTGASAESARQFILSYLHAFEQGTPVADDVAFIVIAGNPRPRQGPRP